MRTSIHRRAGWSTVRPVPVSTPRRAGAAAVGLALCLATVGCGSGSEPTAAGDGTPTSSSGTAPSSGSGDGAVDEVVFPGDEWEVAEAASLGLDAAELDGLMGYLGDNDSHCGVVVKDGRVVAEEYWEGFGPDDDEEIFSASKSVTSTLVGIAQDEGHLSLDDPASTWISEWVGTPSEAVTVRNLVSNDSGRYWDFETDYTTMAILEPDKTQFSIDLDQQHDPGTHWEYNNAAIQTLERVVTRSTGTDMGDYAAEKLFEPLGMTAEYARDPAGNALAFMGVQAGCQDMARFGYLFLREGRWEDEQVVSAEWVAEATTTSQDLNERYGYLWWRGFEGLPDDAYAALGLGNQIVLVLPSQDMVVVRIGAPPSGGEGVASQGAMLSEMATRAIAAADG